MSKFDKMIKELCPEGVEMVKLGDVCLSIKTGKLNANAMVSGGQYPFYTCDATPTTIDQYAFDTEAIIVTGNGSQVGHINYYKGKFNAYQRTYVLSEFKNITFPYAYHFFKWKLKSYIINNSKKGSVPYITLPMLLNFEIPLPPLSIQQKIVSVLDSFTTLIDKMKQEVEKRKKQMEYYREKLLTFEDGESEWKTLGEILVIKAGGDVPEGTIKGQSYPTKSCPYPVYSNGKEEQALYGYCPNFRNSNDAITVSARGSIGYHTVRKGGFTPIVRLITMEPKTDDNIFYVNYALYLTEILGSQGGIPQLTVPMIKRITIPIPPLSKQSEIVSTLDKFESYITKLEKMIVLRQKQYEYHREQLLTFE